MSKTVAIRKPIKFHNGSVITSIIKLPSRHRQHSITIAASSGSRAHQLLIERINHINMSKGHFNAYFSRNMASPPTPLLQQEQATPERLVSLFTDEEIWVEGEGQRYYRLESVL